MEKFKRVYTKIAKSTKEITTTKDDFFFNVRLAVLTAKTTKNTIPEQSLKILIHNLWVQFIKDCENTNIGLDKAIEKVFKKYK